MEELKGLNLGSGQRRFESVPQCEWINVDCVSRPGQVPDIIADARDGLPFEEGYFDYVVLQHVIEHFGCGEATFLIDESHRILKSEGSLIVTCPDIWKLADRWVNGGDPPIDDYIFLVNVYGAYQGEEGDRHLWNYTQERLEEYVKGTHNWDWVGLWTGFVPPGAEIAQDWWMCYCEAIK